MRVKRAPGYSMPMIRCTDPLRRNAEFLYPRRCALIEPLPPLKGELSGMLCRIGRDVQT
jgi:hypothetical protein